MHPVGFEPTHLAALEPESGVYANFTTGAFVCVVYQKIRPRVKRGLSKAGGGSRIRTGDMLLAKQPLYQLSYTPKGFAGGPDKNRTCDLVLIRDAL